MAERNADDAIEKPRGAEAVEPLLEDLQRGVEALHALRVRIAEQEARVYRRRDTEHDRA